MAIEIPWLSSPSQGTITLEEYYFFKLDREIIKKISLQGEVLLANQDLPSVLTANFLSLYGSIYGWTDSSLKEENFYSLDGKLAASRYRVELIVSWLTETLTLPAGRSIIPDLFKIKKVLLLEDCPAYIAYSIRNSPKENVYSIILDNTQLEGCLDLGIFYPVEESEALLLDL